MGAMPEQGVHRWLVESLEDPVALAQVSLDDFLAPELWRLAVERLRLRRFGHLPEWEGAAAVGAHLGARFLASEWGQLMRESISVMPLDRALEAVVMPLADRLRRSAEFDFRARPGGGGFIEINGPIAVGAATMQGFFQVIVDAIPGQHVVRVAKDGPQHLTLEVSVSA